MSVFISTAMFMMVMSVGMMIVVAVMAVVRAAFRRRAQLAVQKVGCQLFHRHVCRAGAHGDAVVIKIGKGALADASCNDDAHALLA